MVQSVCKGYEHTILVDNELRVFLLSFICVILFLPQGGMGFSRTPDRDFCFFYPCEIILSHIPRHTRSSNPYVSSLSEKQNPSLVFSGDRKIPTRGPTVPVGNEACRVSH